MNEMNPCVLLNSEAGKIEVINDCWKYNGKDFVFYGFKIADLLYGCGRGLIGRGATLSQCSRNEWCVNPWHRKVTYREYKNERQCRWGHELNEHGKCKVCERIKKTKWRTKKKTFVE